MIWVPKISITVRPGYDDIQNSRLTTSLPEGYRYIKDGYTYEIIPVGFRTPIDTKRDIVVWKYRYRRVLAVTFCANDCCQSHSSITILLSTSIRKPARNTIRSHLLHQLLITSSSTCTSSINIIFTRMVDTRSPLPHKIINSHMSNSASSTPPL